MERKTEKIGVGSKELKEGKNHHPKGRDHVKKEANEWVCLGRKKDAYTPMC